MPDNMISGKTGAPGARPTPGDEKPPPSLDLRDVFYSLGLVTLVVTILSLAANPLAPIALAILIWFLINAVAQAMRQAPVIGPLLPEGIAVAASAVLTLSAMLLAGQLIISNLSDLSEGLSGLDVKLADTLAQIEESIGFSFGVDVRSTLDNLNYASFIGGIISVLTALAGNISSVLLFVLFLLLDQPYYDAKLRALFPNPERRERVRAVLAKIGNDARIYIWIMTVVSLLVGLFTYGIASAFGLKGAVFWGFLAFALNFIPTIGSFAGVAFPTIFAVVQFDTAEEVLGFAAALGVVQFVMGNLLLPRMTGGRLNLSEFVVILSLVVWGAMWGVAGMFLAVPLMMVLAIVLAQFESTRPVAILLSKTGRVGPA